MSDLLMPLEHVDPDDNPFLSMEAILKEGCSSADLG
jgi:hypothetical protein